MQVGDVFAKPGGYFEMCVQLSNDGLRNDMHYMMATFRKEGNGLYAVGGSYEGNYRTNPLFSMDMKRVHRLLGEVPVEVPEIDMISIDRIKPSKEAFEALAFLQIHRDRGEITKQQFDLAWNAWKDLYR